MMRFNRFAAMLLTMLVISQTDALGQDDSAFHPVVFNSRQFGQFGGPSVTCQCGSCNVAGGYGDACCAPLKPSIFIDMHNVLLDILRSPGGPPRCHLIDCALPKYRPLHYFCTPLIGFPYRWGCAKGPGCLCCEGCDYVETNVDEWSPAESENLDAPMPPELATRVRVIQPWKSRGVVTTAHWDGRPQNGMIFSSHTRRMLSAPRAPAQQLRMPQRID